MSDLTGKMGEGLFQARIMDFRCRGYPIFVPYFLGDKFPNFDYLVELLDTATATPFFFAQIRATQEDYAILKNGQRKLLVAADKKEINRMVRYPAPTYFFGINVNDEKVYIKAMDRIQTSGFSRIATAYELNCLTLEQLWYEVRDYWTHHNTIFRSQFT